MIRILGFLCLFLLHLLCGGKLYASQNSKVTLIPILVGDITTFIPLLSPVGHPSIIKTGAEFNLSWQSVNGATYYKVIIFNSFGVEVLYTTSETSYVLYDLEVGNYTIDIQACNANNQCGAVSNVGSISVTEKPSWMQTSPTSVADAGGGNAEPSEVVDMAGAIVRGLPGVSGGQASYNIPIELPPGRHGMQPSISLSYNSQGGNGLLGVGWSLNAGSSISRCSATFAQDGTSRAVTFNASTDKLCLDGQRLISVQGTYGAANTEYRTEMDSFVKVIQHGGLGDISSSFTLYKPDGSRATYGENANSRFLPGGLNQVLAWKITQESSSSGNNTINYQYDTVVAGEHLLKTIYYTGSGSELGSRRVVFNYDSRTDKRISYIQGGYLKTLNRLKSIETYADSYDLVSKYNLDYSYSRNSNRTLLKMVKRCGQYEGVEQCSVANEFEWLDNRMVSNPEPIHFNGQQYFRHVRRLNEFEPMADIDGDGVADWKGVNTNAETEVISQNNLAFDNTCKYISDIAQYSCITFDADMDGISDLYKISNNFLYIAYSSKGAGFVNTNIYVNQDLSKSEKVLAAQDFNGDGWVDLAILRFNNGWETPVIYLNTRNANQPFINTSHNLYSLDPGLEYYSTFVGDVDGNGLNDILISKSTFYDNKRNKHRHPMGQPVYFLLNKSTTNSVAFERKNIPDAVRLGLNRKIDENRYEKSVFHYLIDVNGDGRQDFLSWDSGYLGVHLNNGRGEFYPVQNMGPILASRSFVIDINKNYSGEPENRIVEYPKYFDALRVADVNGDGINELLVPGKRVVTGCTKVYNGWPNRKEVTICGAGIYGTIKGANNTSSLINANKLDKSIYQFDAIFFDSISLNSVQANIKSTEFYGGVRETTFVDAFGDGLLDSVFVYEQPTEPTSYTNVDLRFGSNYGAYISRNRGAVNDDTDYNPVDYLQSASDGLGNSSEWRYRPLSTGEGSAGQNKLYSTEHSEVGSGYVHFASSMYVVQSLKLSDGQDGHNETQYAYQGAMYNLQGRGFSGFNHIWEKDMQREKTVHSIFEQKFPKVGLLTSQTVSVGNGVVNQITNTWVDNPQHSISKVYNNIRTSSVQQSWDLNGIALSTRSNIVNTNDVDPWGNIKKVINKHTDYIKGQPNTYTNIIETSFAVDTSSWWLNRFNWTRTTSSTAQRSWGGDPAGTADKPQWLMQTVNAWDSIHKQPTKVTYSASNSSCSRVEETAFNSFGLPLWIKETGQSSTCLALGARQTSFTYTKDGISQASDGYFPHKVTNAKGHITTTLYDVGLGVVTKTLAPNNIVTETQYDAVGRPVQVKQTGIPTRYMRYLLATEGNSPPQDNNNLAVFLVRSSGAGMPDSEQYFDAKGRVLRTATQGFDGGFQYVDQHYDALGRLVRQSIPYGNGTAADYTEFSQFDALDRPGLRTIPNGHAGGLTSEYSYNGLTTSINVQGRTMSRTYGSQGWLYETVDAQNGTNRFAYDSAGRPLVIRDANSNDIKASYNGFGHKTLVQDPNQGTTVFGYNSLGELEKQTDANGVVLSNTFDVLGRVTRKVTTGGNAPGTETFVWDTIKQGMLSSETANGVTRSYRYTAALQLSQTTVTLDGQSRTVKHQYDGFYGRPKALEYPNGLTLKYSYNDYGYLEKTSNAASGYVYREITAMDEAGHIVGASLANKAMTESRSYYNEGNMASVEVDGRLGRIHAHYYDTYDEFMNLIGERNGVTGLRKNYRYDTLNRLIEYQFNNTSPSFSATVNYAYDKVGNLLKKTDYSANKANAYRYGGSGCNNRPNAVCQLERLNGTTVNFQYDNRGNLRVGDGLTMTYNALDKPLSISGRGATTRFVYGSDGMRAKQSRNVNGGTTTTYYVDKYYEVDNDGSWRAYLDDIGLLSYTPQRGHLLHFTLRDRLGSATTLADQNGNIISQRYFDPFGRTSDLGYNHKLDIQNKDAKLSQLQDLAYTNKNRRGFTDHEHLNEQQLIHMNGRVYDYNLGRFMSVDPLIQSPTSTQSINPYSYIMNNPLAGTDPTGYSGCAASRIQSTCDNTLSQHGGNGKADAGFGGGNKGGGVSIKSNGNNSYTASAQLNKNTALEVDFKVANVGSIGANASKGDSGSRGGYTPEELVDSGYPPYARFINDIGGDWRMRPGGVSVQEDQQVRAEASAWAGLVGGSMLAGGALTVYIGAEATTLVFFAASGGDVETLAGARLGGVTKGLAGIPGRVQSRINVSNESWAHVLKRHFSGKPNASQFSVSQSELKSLLQSKQVVGSPVTRTVESADGLRYLREVDMGRAIGVDAMNGNAATSVMTTMSDKYGNLITAFPGVLK